MLLLKFFCSKFLMMLVENFMSAEIQWAFEDKGSYIISNLCMPLLTKVAKLNSLLLSWVIIASSFFLSLSLIECISSLLE